MDINLNCYQVESLIKFYLEGTLAPSLKEYVHKHIAQCSVCQNRLKQFQQMLQQHDPQNRLRQKDDKELAKILSAYIDNELDSSENIKVKKITISNPSARKKLETLYNYQKILHSAYEKTKNNSKFDYSKNIISTINNPSEYYTLYFRNIMIMIFLLFVAIMCGFLYLYF